MKIEELETISINHARFSSENLRKAGELLKSLGYTCLVCPNARQGYIIRWITYGTASAVAQVSESRFGALAVYTKHIPNQYTGTGFVMVESYQPLTEHELKEGFAHCPNWVRFDLASIEKWGGIDQYLLNEKILKYKLLTK